VFVDESGFNTAMTRGHARAPSHLRAVDAVPHNHGRNDTLVCAVSLVGPLAPLILDGPMTGLVFEWCVREHLCPTLVKGQVVIMDDLSSHRRPITRTLLEEAGCTLLYLCAYSPDFSPIELFFSKLKAVVRGAAWHTVDTLMDGIDTANNAVTQADLAHWFKHAHPSVLLWQML
jgi:DDE superfamily endonuclease